MLLRPGVPGHTRVRLAAKDMAGVGSALRGYEVGSKEYQTQPEDVMLLKTLELLKGNNDEKCGKTNHLGLQFNALGIIFLLCMTLKDSKVHMRVYV